jgi:hypothetical protein
LGEGVNDREESLPVFRRRAGDERIVAEREWKVGLKNTKPQDKKGATMACSAMRALRELVVESAA